MRAETQTKIFEYIEIFYEEMRLHSTLEYISSAEFEEDKEGKTN